MKVDGLFDPLIGKLEKVMDMRVEQHGLLTSNLANASTPNYHSQYLDFSSVLGQVLDRQSDDVVLSRTDTAHFGNHGETGGNIEPEKVEVEPPAWAMDGNSVNPDLENMRIMENTVMFGALSRVIARKFSSLRSVITEER